MQLDISFRETVPLGRIHQLTKASEAVSVEVAVVQSATERLLKRLKVLEAMACSSLVNLKNWNAENNEKLSNIHAPVLHDRIKSSHEQLYCEDKDSELWIRKSEEEPSHNHGFPDDVFEGSHGDEEGPSSFASCASTPVMQFVWHLSLSDIVSVFEKNNLLKAEHCIREEFNRDGDAYISSLYKEDVPYAGLHHSHEGIKKENECLQKQLEHLAKRASTLEKEKDEISLALINANQHIWYLENQEVSIQSAISEEYRLAIERTVEEDVISLRKKSEDSEKRLNECKKLVFEMSQKAYGTEKELIETKRILEESGKKNVFERERLRSMSEMELHNYKIALEKAKHEILIIKEEQNALALHNMGMKMRLEEVQAQVNVLEKERANLIQQLSECRVISEKIRQDYSALGKERVEVERLLDVSRSKLDTMLKENFNIENEKRAMEEAYKAVIVDFEQREDHVVMLEKEVLSMKDKVSHIKDELLQEKLAKKTMHDEIERKDEGMKVLAKELDLVNAKQESLVKTLECEKLEKKQVMQKLHEEIGRRRALMVSLELAEHEKTDLLVEVEHERMAKDAVLEELEALQDRIGNLESELMKLKAESTEREMMFRKLMYKEPLNSNHLYYNTIMEMIHNDEMDDAQTILSEGKQTVSLPSINLKEHNLEILEQDSGKLVNHLAANVVCGNGNEVCIVKRSKALESQTLYHAHHASIPLLVELQALKRAMQEKIAAVEEGQKKAPSALLALGCLHFL